MSEEIQEITVEDVTKSLLDLAVESWRLSRLFERLVLSVDLDEKNRFIGGLRWFEKNLTRFLADVNIRVVSLENQEYDSGMAATALNIDDFSDEDSLVVDRMIEPIILGPKGILRTGTFTLRKK